MAGAAGGTLAGQVSLGGGFGFLSAGYGTTPDEFKEQLSLARSTFPPTSQLPVGVGYLGWQLEKRNSESIWLAFGENLGKWVQFVRDHDTRMGKDKKTVVFVQISTVEEALVAVNEWNGGHGASYALPLLNLVPSILSAMPVNSPPVLAAGGLANGGHIAAVLTLGASGAVLGTRFLLAYESLYSDAQRQALIGARSSLSVRSMAWDHARGTLEWPVGVDGRGLRNSTVVDFEQEVGIENLQKKFKEGLENQDTDRMIVWAGTGVGLMNQTQSAKSIVEELHRECIDHLSAASQLYA
ncbi:hypothetical protein B0H10DRAFT_2172166 [Mycena sp. CBHHK59/15]|nr:hypothetical protein B0H10DRAFT_2172166 [Mycena sp. CBHHK59/15]